MTRFGTAALLALYAAGSLVVVLSGFASAQPEKATAVSWFTWMGALGGILLASFALARWQTPKGTKRHRILYSLVVFLLAWLPCAGLFVLLSEKIEVARKEFRFSSVLREVRQLDPDRALQHLAPAGLNPPENLGKALRSPGLVVVRAGGAHGKYVTPWSGTVGRIDQNAGKVSELQTVVVVYRLDKSLAYAVVDWPHRRTVEWGSWTDTPDRYIDRMCHAHKGPEFPCVETVKGGPQWDALLETLGGYEPPAAIQKSTLMTLAELYAAGIFVLFFGFIVVGARAHRAHA